MSPPEHNLLLVLFALQHRLVDGDQLAAATSEWIRDKQVSFGKILLQQGSLDREEVELLGRLVTKHVAKHGAGEQSLTAVGVLGAEEGASEFAAMSQGDASIERTLVELSKFARSTATFQPSDSAPEEDELSLNFSLQSRLSDIEGGDFSSVANPEEERFAILREHAHGGLGQVSVALDKPFNREVALKEIRSEYVSLVESRQRFFQEAIINGGLEHPGIVPVYAMGHSKSGTPYYAMRLIRGESFKRQLRRLHGGQDRLHWDEKHKGTLHRLLTHFVDACQAIAYAHSRGIIHRDIKPSNIMIGKYGETLVVDWGLSKSIGRSGSTVTETDEVTLIPNTSDSRSSSSFETRIGQALGTPQYMSPEQASGKVSKVGTASDIFNLGATLFELLTGQAPFKGAQFETIENCDFDLPRSLNPTIDPALESICLKALAKLPKDRYSTAEELATDVQAWQADLPTLAHSDTWLQSSRRWMRKHQVVVAGALAATLMFAVGVGVIAAVTSRAYERLKKANQAEIAAKQRAEEKERFAQSQGALALEALNTIVFNVQNRLADLPSASSARRELLRSALDGLERVSRELQLQDEVEQNRAKALIDLGSVFISIGDDPELGTALREGTDLIAKATNIRRKLLERSPKQASAMRDLCEAFIHLGTAHEKLGETDRASQVFEELESLCQRLMELDDSSKSLQVQAESLAKIGDHLLRTDSSNAALERFQGAKQIIDQLLAANKSRSPADIQNLADIHRKLGHAFLRQGSFAEAEAAYRQSLSLLQQIDAIDTDQYVIRRLQAKYSQDLGKALFEQRRLDEALELYLQAFEIREAAAKLDPANTLLQSELQNTHSRLGEVYLYQRDYPSSLRHYVAARDISLELSKADPSNAEHQLMVSQAFTNIASIHFVMKDFEKSLSNHLRAREVSQQLLARDPSNADKSRDLAITWLNIGLSHLRLNEIDSAIESFGKSIELCEALHSIDPDDAQVHDYALTCFWYLADLYTLQGKDDRVLATYRQAILFSDKILERNPEQRQVRAEQAEIKGYLALFQKDYAAAADAARMFGEANPSNADNWYNSACIYCLAAEEVQEESQRIRYIDGAITSLQKSLEAGYDDFENMREDGDLAILKTDERFLALFPEN